MIFRTNRHPSESRNSRRIYFAILMILIIVFLNSCTNPVDIAMETKDYRKGKDAVLRITDQSELTKLATEAIDHNVRAFATEKIIDTSTLEKIARMDMNGTAGIIAVNKLSNQSKLITIALEAMSIRTRVAATEKLTNPILLAKLALESTNSHIRKAAIKVLLEPEKKEILAKEKDDNNSQLLYKLISAIEENVPEKHQIRLIQRVLPVILVLNKIEIKEKIGEIRSIRFNWYSTSAYYTGHKTGNKKGESFSCNIKLNKFGKTLHKKWSTKFPENTASLGFSSASIDLGEFLEPIFDRLSQSALENIITDNYGPEISRAARKKLDALETH